MIKIVKKEGVVNMSLKDRIMYLLSESKIATE